MHGLSFCYIINFMEANPHANTPYELCSMIECKNACLVWANHNHKQYSPCKLAPKTVQIIVFKLYL